MKIWKKSVEDRISDALSFLVTEHANGARDTERVVDASYYINKINIEDEAHSRLFEEPIGAKIPVIVIVGHGEEVVNKLRTFLESKL